MEVTADFNDDFWEPPETEFQPLLDFESQIKRDIPHNDVALLTQRIKWSFLDYVRQGIMMDAVRRHRLYKQQYRDFVEYCELGLGRSHRYCNRIIQAAQICLQLIKAKFKILPTSVAQALPLLKFANVDKYGQSQLQDKWQTVVDGFPPQLITAAKIQEALDENPEDRAKQIRIKGKAYKVLQQKAVAAGMLVSEYLEHLIVGGSFSEDDLSNDEEEEFFDGRSDEQTVDSEYTLEQKVILEELDSDEQTVDSEYTLGQKVILEELDIVFKNIEQFVTPDDGRLTQRPKLPFKNGGSSGLSPNHPSID